LHIRSSRFVPWSGDLFEIIISRRKSLVAICPSRPEKQTGGAHGALETGEREPKIAAPLMMMKFKNRKATPPIPTANVTGLGEGVFRGGVVEAV
jgi:hypothetical protein